MRSVSRRTFLGGAIAAAAASGFPNVHGATLPNFVFILAVDIGYGDLGCYGAPPPQLYDLSQDPSEMTDVADQNPEIVGELISLQTKLKAERYSRPGFA